MVVGHVEDLVPAGRGVRLAGLFRLFGLGALLPVADAFHTGVSQGLPGSRSGIAVVLAVVVAIPAVGEVEAEAFVLGDGIGDVLVLLAVEDPVGLEAFGLVGGHFAQGGGDVLHAEGAAPDTGVSDVAVEGLGAGPLAAVIPSHGQVETSELPGIDARSSGVGSDEFLVIVDGDGGTVGDDGQDHPFAGRPDIRLPVLANLLLAYAEEVGVQAQLAVGIAVVGEAEEEGVGFIVLGDFAESVAEQLILLAVLFALVVELAVVPLVGPELPLEGDGARIQFGTVLPTEGGVDLPVGHVEDLVPTGRGVRLQFGSGLAFTGLLGDGDGLEDLLGAGADDLHFTGTDFLGGVVVDLEDDGVVLGAGLHEVDPVHLRLHLESEVGDGVGFHDGVLRLGDVLDALVRDLEGVGLGFTAEGEFDNGGQAHLGVGVSEGGTLRDGERGDGDLFGVDRGVKVGVGEDVHDGVRGLVLHGVGNLDRIGGGYGILGLRDDELEGFREGDLDGGVVVQGQDHSLVGDLDVLEDGIAQAAAHGAHVGLLAVHGDEQVPVLHGEGRGLAHREILAVDLDDLAVQRPAENAGGVADDGEVGLSAGTGNLEGDHLVGGIGDGDAHHLAVFDEFFDLLDEHPVSRCALDGQHVGFQVAYLGLERGDPVAEFGVIVLAGASHEEETHCKSCK